MKLTVTFKITDETRRAISERMWPTDQVPRTRTGLATVQAMSERLAAARASVLARWTMEEVS